MENELNARDQLIHTADWLGWQDEDLSAGLKCAEDAIKLHRYWQEHDNLPELADEDFDDDGDDISKHRVLALGYDPLGRAEVEEKEAAE